MVKEDFRCLPVAGRMAAAHQPLAARLKREHHCARLVENVPFFNFLSIFQIIFLVENTKKIKKDY